MRNEAAVLGSEVRRSCWESFAVNTNRVRGMVLAELRETNIGTESYCDLILAGVDWHMKTK